MYTLLVHGPRRSSARHRRSPVGNGQAGLSVCAREGYYTVDKRALRSVLRRERGKLAVGATVTARRSTGTVTESEEKARSTPCPSSSSRALCRGGSSTSSDRASLLPSVRGAGADTLSAVPGRSTCRFRLRAPPWDARESAAHDARATGESWPPPVHGTCADKEPSGE